MARESLIEIVEWASGLCISAHPLKQYEKRNDFIEEVLDIINSNYKLNAQISTCLTHIRTLIQEGTINEIKIGDTLTYSIQKAETKKELERNPLLSAMPLVTFSTYNNVETLGITLSQDIAQPTATLFNERYNSKNLFFQALGTKAIMCYYFKSNDNDNCQITFEEYLRRIFGGIRLFENTKKQNTLDLTYEDIYAGEKYMYDTDTNRWVVYTDKPTYCGIYTETTYSIPASTIQRVSKDESLNSDTEQAEKHSSSHTSNWQKKKAPTDGQKAKSTTDSIVVQYQTTK